ncbi:MAG: PilZ domain-containing protein [Acidobacteriota bacterium]
MNVNDKRRAQRFPMALPVKLKVEELDGAEFEATQTRDVSSGGIYFEYESHLEVGTSLEFVLTLPGEITKGSSVRIRCMGKVVRVDKTSEQGDHVGIAATIERYEFVRES